jgi:hypothetical protein
MRVKLGPDLEILGVEQLGDDLALLTDKRLGKFPEPEVPEGAICGAAEADHLPLVADTIQAELTDLLERRYA